MAAGSLLLLIDDIATALDDIALMTKVAASKTAAVVGDDLAVNAQQLTGIAADRELRVVWAVAKGSLGNKLILVPTAILLSTFTPWAVTPLLAAGGVYLCYEGVEKLTHHWLTAARVKASDLGEQSERLRIRGAVRTDLVLSAEITVISLGTVATAPLHARIGVLVAVGLIMTVGVYGLVAAIVKLDDFGLYLSRVRRGGYLVAALNSLGRGLVGAAPWLMRLLAVGGTIAMFVVGGSIVVHACPALTRFVAPLAVWMHSHGLPAAVSAMAARLVTPLAAGIAVGTAALMGVLLTRLAGARR